MTRRESKYLRFSQPIIAILVDIPEETIEAAPNHVVKLDCFEGFLERQQVVLISV